MRMKKFFIFLLVLCALIWMPIKLSLKLSVLRDKSFLHKKGLEGG